MEVIEQRRGVVPAKAVANYVLDWSKIRGLVRTNLEIQKLVYFCHVCYLIQTEKPLIRESFEAWKYGPVVPTLYRALRKFGDREVNSKLTSLSVKSGTQEIVEREWTTSEKEALDSALSSYGRLSTSQLVDISHQENGPWARRYEPDLRESLGSRILNSDIASFYSRTAHSTN